MNRPEEPSAPQDHVSAEVQLAGLGWMTVDDEDLRELVRPCLAECLPLDEGEVAMDVVAIVQAETDDVIVEHSGPSDFHESSSSSSMGSGLSSISSRPICRNS
jgi:hypothetical protein